MLVREARIAALSLHAHGERELKGIGRVPLFELLHCGKRPQPLEGTRNEERGMRPGQFGLVPHPSAALLENLTRSRIVGRDAEIAELKRRIDAALQGTGATIFLSGEPGIGKTRLATEAAAHARQQGFRVLTGRCEEEGAAPYLPPAPREAIPGGDYLLNEGRRTRDQSGADRRG